MDLVKSIYHETQEAGSMLCAQHALNNLLQAALFTPQDLAHMALELDQLEEDQLDEEEKKKRKWKLNNGRGSSENYDDSGFFSVQVIEEALKVWGLRLVRWKSQDMKAVHDTPEKMEAFILNHQLHWFTIRRFAVPERFYNLDSCKPSPEWISPTLLSLTLNEAENQGYSIFVIVPSSESSITGLPACDAADLAATLPTPSSRFGNGVTSSALPSISSAFSGKGHTLGSTSASTSTSSTSKPTTTSGKNKRRPEDDDIIIDGDQESESSVEGESEKRRKRRIRFLEPEKEEKEEEEDNDDEVVIVEPEGAVEEEVYDEEEMMRRAVEESLKLAGGQQGSTKTSSSSSSSSSTSRGGLVLPKSSTGRVEGKKEKEKKRSGREEEDEELERALKASLEGLAVSDDSGNGKGKGKAKEEEAEGGGEEEDDNPSLEEMRRRRLARFG